MAILKKSCCTLSLRVGVMIVAVGSIIIHGAIGGGSFYVLQLIVKKLEGMPNHPMVQQLIDPLKRMAYNLQRAMATTSVFMCLTSVAVIVAWILHMKWLILPWVVMQAVFSIVLLYVMLQAISHSNKVTNLGALPYIISFAILAAILLIQVYCILVVGCYYVEQAGSLM